MKVTLRLDPTHCDFSFVSDATVRSVLDDYFAQAVAAYQAGSFLGAVVGCGAVAEGILTWLLINREPLARSAGAAQKNRSRPIEDWALQTLVDVAEEIRLFGNTDLSRLLEAVRNWRNLVHPYRRVRGTARFDNAVALSGLRAVTEMASAVGARSQPIKVAAEDMNFSWFIDQQVAACRAPATINELQFLAQNGVKSLVRVAKERRMTPSDVSSVGMVDCPIGVADFNAPNQKQLKKVVNFMTTMVRAHKTVAVSCGAGYGRTGTVLACYMIDEGKTDVEALQYLEAHRRESYLEIINNPSSGQLSAIREYAKSLGRSRPAASLEAAAVREGRQVGSR